MYNIYFIIIFLYLRLYFSHFYLHTKKHNSTRIIINYEINNEN